MARKNLYDIIKDTPFDVKGESLRISRLFCSWHDTCDQLYSLVDGMISTFPEEFRGRTLSLDDFNETYGFDFCRDYQAKNEEDLITYCEYVLSLCSLMEEDDYNPMGSEEEFVLETLKDTITACMDALGQTPVKKGCFTIFVDKNPSALAVSEAVEPAMAASILEYNHRRLNGNLTQKHLLLKTYADDFESKRQQLKSINGSVESQLGQLFNKFIRHTHSKTPYIATLTDKQLEDIYDDIYQMYLLAIMQLENSNRKKRIADLLTEINGS